MRIASLFCMLLVTYAVFGADVFRSVDANGNVVYTDRPVTGKEEAVTIDVIEVRAPAQAPAEAGDANDDPDDTAASDVDPAVEAAAVAAQRREERARNCQIARDRNSRYETAHRLYRELPNGDREYLDDAEIDAARAQAIADIETWCN